MPAIGISATRATWEEAYAELLASAGLRTRITTPTRLADDGVHLDAAPVVLEGARTASPTAYSATPC